LHCIIATGDLLADIALNAGDMVDCSKLTNAFNRLNHI